MAGSTWFASSDKATPPIPPAGAEQFLGQSIQDNADQPRTSSICGISRRVFFLLLPIFILVAIVIALAAGLGIALGKKSSSEPSVIATSPGPGTSTTQTAETMTITSAVPTTISQWVIPSGALALNFTQVSTTGGGCAPTGWIQEPQERQDYVNIAAKGSTYYAQESFGGVGFLSSELIYVPEGESGPATYAYTFSFGPRTIGADCNVSNTLTTRFVRSENANCLATWTLTSDCVGPNGDRILTGEYCQIYFETELPAALASR
ncbi:hypothetical protein TWF718_007706 [Orbilia javanica]|uniref:Uncharacterized protein n=1 Tax=Orbilia javanica TaxID=47235 RepID=A0AAN8MUZ0_9PEZI